MLKSPKTMIEQCFDESLNIFWKLFKNVNIEIHVPSSPIPTQKQKKLSPTEAFSLGSMKFLLQKEFATIFNLD
jgi:hypothetical protein